MGMNAEIKAQWVAALRSGEYQQAEGALNKGGKFCCLGVLCDLAVKSGLPVEVSQSEIFKGELEYDTETAWLPDSVREWAGLDRNGPELPSETYSNGSSGKVALTQLNDGSHALLNDVPRHTFEQIADLIEASPL